MDRADLHQTLLDPATYPHRPVLVEFRETHASRLYFAGELVYKVKKPVNFGFLDFSTQKLRAHFCQEELRLNARFAPGTYLRVAEIHCSRAGRFNLAGDGICVEHAVVMARLPQARMLTTLLAQRDPTLPSEALRLAQRLAALHEQSPRCIELRTQSLDWLHRNWEENFAQTRPFAASTLSNPARKLIRRYVATFLQTQTPLLLQRAAQGLVRDGHGDLHAEHICLTEPIRIYDCIEFNQRFRVADILADIAFLLMDLDFRQRRDLAALIWQHWARTLEQESTDAVELLRFFKLYRAFVRGKVDAFLADDPTAAPATREQAATLSRQYFNLALGYLTPPTLVLTCGLMGVGKSTLAARLATALGGVQLRSDVVRKELADIEPLTPVVEHFGAGLYRPAASAATYLHLLEQSRLELAQGHSVIVDAAFLRRDDRHAFRLAAATLGIPSWLLHLNCPPAMAAERLTEREARGGDPSDGRQELINAQRTAFELPGSEEQPIAVDSAADVDYNVQAILCRLCRPHAVVSS